MRPLGFYRGFGFTIASEVPLSGFDALDKSPGQPDVHVRLVEGPKPVLVEGDGHFAFQANDDACFWIRDGRVIDVWLAPAADLTLATDLLQGTAFAILLFQRGRWPVHVSAVSVAGGVWLFSGKSGEGKSTLAAWMRSAHGCTILSDDAGVLSVRENRMYFSPGARNLKLLPDAVAALPATGALSGLSSVGDSEGKLHFRLPRLSRSECLPVLGFVDLATNAGAAPSVSVLQGAAALQATRTALYRPWFGRNLCAPAETLRFCAEASRMMPLYRFERPRDHGRLDESNRLLAATMGLTQADTLPAEVLAQDIVQPV